MKNKGYSCALISCGICNAWIASGTIKLVTLAPERSGLEVKYLKEHNIVASIGYSNVTYKEVTKAINAGVNHITHLFNQIRELHHREPGVVGAALLHDAVKVEIIVDGIHVHP